MTRFLSLHDSCKMFHTNFHVPNIPPYAIPAVAAHRAGFTGVCERMLTTLYDEFECRGLRRALEYTSTGNAYFLMNKTKPATLGYAMYQSPVGILSYFLDKYETWTDPRSPAFQPPGQGTQTSGTTDENIL